MNFKKNGIKIDLKINMDLKYFFKTILPKIKIKKLRKMDQSFSKLERKISNRRRNLLQAIQKC